MHFDFRVAWQPAVVQQHSKLSTENERTLRTLRTFSEINI